MQKYLPFLTEAELFPDDFDRCLEKYNQSQVQIAYVKSFVFPHMDNVQKGREQAETLDANLGTILDWLMILWLERKVQQKTQIYKS